MYEKLRKELANKFCALLAETVLPEDLEFEIDQAERRLMSADMYAGGSVRPATPKRAAEQLLRGNPQLDEWLPWTTDYWRGSETPEEFVTSILPKSDSLDQGDLVTRHNPAVPKTLCTRQDSNL